ncbi:MAG: BMC domain-containing protein [Bacillota bacterium]
MDALGMIELNSIAVGVDVADTMLKAGNVSLLNTQPVCPGKYLVLIRGKVSEVESSVASGEEAAGFNLVDQFVIPNIHPQVFPALTATTSIDKLDAVGIVETFSLASCVEAADMAVKASEIELVEIRLGRGLGGKSFVVMNGVVSAVQNSVDTVEERFGTEGQLVSTVVIPSPHQDLPGGIL